MPGPNPFHVSRDRLDQHQACMREWVMSGVAQWTHGRCAAAAAQAAAAGSSAASAAAALSATGSEEGDRPASPGASSVMVRTPYLYALFPTLWTREHQQRTGDCRRPRSHPPPPPPPSVDSAAAAASPAASAQASVVSASAASAASSSSSATPASASASSASPPAPAAERRLRLRARSPSQLLRLHLGPEHTRRVQAQCFAAALVDCTPHVSSGSQMPAPGDPMPGAGTPPASPNGGGASPNSPGGAGEPGGGGSGAPTGPVAHRGSTRFSKPVADMGDYLGVVRHSLALRNPLADPLDDPNYVAHIAFTMAAQQHAAQQAAAAQSGGAIAPSQQLQFQQQQLSSLPGPLTSPDRPLRGSGGLIASSHRFGSPGSQAHPLHVDEADDVAEVLPPAGGAAPGLSGLAGLAAFAGSGSLLSSALRRRRKAQDRKLPGNQRMSWAQFLAARNGVAAAAAAAAAAAGGSSAPTSPSLASASATASPHPSPPSSPGPSATDTASLSPGSSPGFSRRRDGAGGERPASEGKRVRFDGVPFQLQQPSQQQQQQPSQQSQPQQSVPSPQRFGSAPPSPTPGGQAPASPTARQHPAPSLLTNLLASMAAHQQASAASSSQSHAQAAGASASGPLSGSASAPPSLLMLRYRMEVESGGRDFAAACDALAAHDERMTDAPAPSGGSVASLERHLAAVTHWFVSNIAYLRSADSAPSSGGGGAPAEPSPASAPRPLEHEYEQLFYQYRADLQARFLTSPAHQQTLLQRMQWKNVTDALAAKAAAAANATAGATP